jgi:Zn-dependent peptidase ImmA (M78 family)
MTNELGEARAWLPQAKHSLYQLRHKANCPFQVFIYVMYDMTMKRTNIYLTQQSIDALRKEQKKTGLSVAELVRRAIEDFLKKQKP